jgi:hypothetical protein
MDKQDKLDFLDSSNHSITRWDEVWMMDDIGMTGTVRDHRVLCEFVRVQDHTDDVSGCLGTAIRIVGRE